MKDQSAREKSRSLFTSLHVIIVIIFALDLKLDKCLKCSVNVGFFCL